MKIPRKYFFPVFYSVSFVLGVFAVIKFYPELHPLPQTEFSVTRDQAEKIATEFISDKVAAEELVTRVNFIIRKEFFEKSENLSYQSRRYREDQYRYWEISMISKKKRGIHLIISSESSESQSGQDLPGSWYMVRITPGGKIIQLDFEKAILDDLKSTRRDSSTDRLSKENGKNAQNTAKKFLLSLQVDTTGLELKSAEFKQDSLGRIYNFMFSDKEERGIVQHRIKVAKDTIPVYYELDYTFNAPEVSSSKINKVLSIISTVVEVIIYLVLFVLLIYFLIHFARRDAISFRLGIPFVIIIMSITFIQSLLSSWEQTFITLLFSTIVITIFYTVGALILYSVGDSLSRQIWPEKLKVTDQFLQGNFLNPQTGKTIFRGIYLGVVSFGIYVVTLYIFHDLLHEEFKIGEDIRYSFSVLFPLLLLLLKSINKSFFYEFFFRLFGISFIKKILKKPAKVLAAGAIFSFVFSADLHFQSALLTILSAVIPTLFFIYYFMRFEIVTTFVGFVVYILLSKAVIFIPTDDPVFFQQGIGILLMLTGLIIYGFIAIFLKSKEPSTATPFVPEYIRKVEERERLMRELEIARNIQQEFLPKATPNIENYQVAAFCQPAWEVGGDYFDFVPLGNRQLGIVIGDVSNKGVSAAFYMTLVKGFLRALAIHRKKPAEILSETNTLFYDNVERGHFISMIFGTLDSAKNEFIFARAGHNPVLLMIGRSSEVKWFTPKGVGIGILENQRFQAVIREKKIFLQSGDILILYTDGYPEAMNESSQEFGEDQLQQILDKYRSLEPEQIILHLENAIKKWEGTKPSIDDRTIIVIKRIR